MLNCHNITETYGPPGHLFPCLRKFVLLIDETSRILRSRVKLRFVLFIFIKMTKNNFELGMKEQHLSYALYNEVTVDAMLSKERCILVASQQ